MRELCPFGSDDKHSILNYYKSSFEYLGVDYQDKAILNIRANLWFPINGKISGKMMYYLKDETEPYIIENTFIDRSYPNKNIACISKRFGRRKTKKGIPIVFDSVDKLHEIVRIEIIWEISDFNEKVVVDYPVKFEKPQQDGIYSLWTYDKPLSIDNYKSGLKIIDGRLENDSNMSVYDDFYFMVLRNDSIVTVEELHKLDSNFRIDFDKLENLPLSVVNTLLHKSIEKIYYGDDSPEVVCFYRAELLLNDYTSYM